MTNTPKFNYLFDFSVSATGGGKKNCIEVAKWFGKHGGAKFIVNEKIRDEVSEYTSNEYYFVKPSNLRRLVTEAYWLEKVIKAVGKPDLFFSYGIPIRKSIGVKNWFHLSNVIPVDNRPEFASTKRYLEYIVIGNRIKEMVAFCDCISAESEYALEKLKIFSEYPSDRETFCFRNGVDKNLIDLMNETTHVESNAITIGTEKYKNIEKCVRVFNEVCREGLVDKLIIIGDPSKIPSKIKKQNNIQIKGIVSLEEVYNLLKKSEIYIHTTAIENSSNASVEGALLSKTSILSNIGPHQELFTNYKENEIKIKNLNDSFLNIKSSEKEKLILPDWEKSVSDLIDKIKVVSNS